MMGRRRPAFAGGFTQIELLVTLALAALLLGLAAPSLYGMIQRKRAVGVAEELRADLRSAQSMAMSSVVPNVAVHFESDPTQSCYVIYLTVFGAAGATTECSCLRPVPCGGGGLSKIKNFSLSSSTGIRFSLIKDSVTVPDAVVLFRKASGDLVRGTGYAENLTLNLDAGSGGELKLRIDGVGRTALCSVGGQHVGHPVC